MKKILPFVLLASLFSLFGLMLFANFSDPTEVPIILLQEHINSEVKIFGKTTYASYSDEASFFRLKDDTGEVRVVAFDNCSQVKKNDLVSVKGKVEIYEGKLEVIAHQISIL